MNFNHYSLFVNNQTVADFEPIPPEGVPNLLADLHQRWADSAGNNLPRLDNCCMWPKCCAHPGGRQISFEAGDCMLILYTAEALASQAANLAAEGNESAEAAAEALADA